MDPSRNQRSRLPVASRGRVDLGDAGGDAYVDTQQDEIDNPSGVGDTVVTTSQLINIQNATAALRRALQTSQPEADMTSPTASRIPTTTINRSSDGIPTQDKNSAPTGSARSPAPYRISSPRFGQSTPVLPTSQWLPPSPHLLAPGAQPLRNVNSRRFGPILDVPTIPSPSERNFNSMQADMTRTPWGRSSTVQTDLVGGVAETVTNNLDQHLGLPPVLSSTTSDLSSMPLGLASPAINAATAIPQLAPDPMHYEWENQTKTCIICLNDFIGQELIETSFPFRCECCHERNFCIGCIKELFLGASKDESWMPPKCCLAIPVRAVAEHLSTAELEIFKAKHLEWSTADRIYCPIPSCSAFIPPHLYIEGIKATEKDDDKPAELAKKPSVSCPECNISLCTECHTELPHAQCPTTDIDPEFAALLRRWKIKRCPKCHTGIRKVYGCPHMQCRCGGNFCFVCLLPIVECRGGCVAENELEDDDDDFQALWDDEWVDEEVQDGGEEGEEEEYNGVIEPDDLDGRAGFHEGDGFEFGEEPSSSQVDTWGCTHYWEELHQMGMFKADDPHQSLQCHTCFRTVTFGEEGANPTTSSQNDHQTQAGENPGGADSQLTKVPAHPDTDSNWSCYCSATTCNNCPGVGIPHGAAGRIMIKGTYGDGTHIHPSQMWKCDCGTECKLCDRTEATDFWIFGMTATKPKGMDAESLAKKGWGCRCGKMICNTCKTIKEGQH